MNSDRRVTLITAVATFVSLTVVSLAVWALTRPDLPPAITTSQASALPASHPPLEFERITVEELKPLVDAGKVVLLDVRSAEQYVAGHIDKALHIPVASVESQVEYLPKDKLIVTYCTCPNEESSGEAALILQRSGLEAKALRGGLEAWSSLGYPVVTGVK